MERLLRPEVLNLDPESTSASTTWDHWHHRFQNFVRSVPEASEEEKLRLLINYVSADIYKHIRSCLTYNDAISVLKSVFVKPLSEVFARHRLSTRKQQPNESVDKYLEELRLLSRDCQFKAVTAEMNRDDCIRDAFIRGLASPIIRQRLLENTPTISLSDAHTQARALELAHQHAQSYQEQSLTVNAVTGSAEEVEDQPDHSTSAPIIQKCFFCGQSRHPRVKCPAKDDICPRCSKKGHWPNVCQSKGGEKSSNLKTKSASVLSSVEICSFAASKVRTTVQVGGRALDGMLDSGSDISLINESTARALHLKIQPTKQEVGLASNSHRVSILGYCSTDLYMLDNHYSAVTLSVLPNLCAEIIIGRDVLQLHSSVQFDFGGLRAPLQVCVFEAARVEPAKLFSSLSGDMKPIAIKSRKHSDTDSKFIEAEVKKLLADGIIEKSISPWRAQVHVVTGFHKRRMVVDYSRTINRFTDLDAYPLPRINDIVNKVAGYNVYSTIDLRSAYHQVPIPVEDRKYTAFEACGELYQSTRIPFAVTNGVAAFQRCIDEVIRKEKLTDTFAYLDDVTIGGKTQLDHDINLEKFFAAARKYGLTINNEKSSFSLRSISLLGYSISDHQLRPDPSRLTPLRELPVPSDGPSLKRAMGMFSHYSKFIQNFSEKIRPLASSSFPLSKDAQQSFQNLKKSIEEASLAWIDNEAPFCVETDASDTTIAATLSQDGRPVAFFSRTLSSSEIGHSSVEKEANAIVESVRYWRHFLLGRHFRLITDQRSVAFMFSTQHKSKCKNEKIMRWRLELSCYTYDITYRPGTNNHAADALSRVCFINSKEKLQALHQSLYHPGVTRLYHWLRSKNLPFSVEEVKQVVSSCNVCAELKPRFFRQQGTLIKSTIPFERLNIDFKGPLPSRSVGKRYLLTIVDEYSRFPFAYPCADVSATTVIDCLTNLFSIFGAPAYIHSDRGASFMSEQLKEFLTSYGVATSRTTAYNPRGNGQVERYNGIIWKTIGLALKSKGLPITHWNDVLTEALHSIRSLLCTSTNSTPHERLFSHQRRSANGDSIPSWLLKPGPVWLKRFNRNSKYEPQVEEVELLEGNHEYAHIKYPDGRETTVSTRHLAPTGERQMDLPEISQASPQPENFEPGKRYRSKIQTKNRMKNQIMNKTGPVQSLFLHRINLYLR